MKVWFSLLAVIILALTAWVGVEILHLNTLFGIIIPYTAIAVFIGGFIIRVVRWGKSPVPFCITTTCGQQQSLPWIKQNKIENPTNTWGVIWRMVLEVTLFRSLFRNTKTEKIEDKLVFGSAQWLWFGSLVFHWSMLIILLRHLRFFLNPVPGLIIGLESLDSFLQIGVPLLYITDVLLVAALTYLFLRRVMIPNIKYISQIADYFPVLLLLGIAASGILGRYVYGVDVAAVKELTMSLVSFKPTTSTTIGTIFYIHIFLVSSLAVYFPCSKLMHAGGIFLSPTRNLANNSRIERYINPWNYEVEKHHYSEYEDEFRDKMRKVGLPLEKE
ncbi:Nitrate reductase, gamma subunit [Syntrophomonas zehnderi OL-4]|uniref:Nitrate reductase, gamma subunit n=1 Tax=Syntrophomonas zehnderi OL-4 TaxID=690567 RepID=A0A0E4GC45_9FIRM|nr:sulfate reduction electron transfer complex DsrMKJOP subunit DsrM [Syntrophomonas zehnderi]CFX70879.1 Nitrate reductase, gamma subunit [Syntrophomonas zehnderi OL-4]